MNRNPIGQKKNNRMKTLVQNQDMLTEPGLVEVDSNNQKMDENPGKFASCVTSWPRGQTYLHTYQSNGIERLNNKTYWLRKYGLTRK